MLLLSWKTFLDRWQTFIGALVTVCLGVALVQSSLLTLLSIATAQVPTGLSPAEAYELVDAYAYAQSMFQWVLVLALLVTIGIVSSTFSFAVAQRRREIALFRIAGADRRQVRTLLVGEAILLGLAGTALGIVMGLPLMRLQVWALITLEFVPPDFVAQWRPWVLLVSLGSGVATAVLGVLAASRHATRVRPLESIRESGQAGRAMTPLRWVLGILFTVSGVTAAALLPGASATLPITFIHLTAFAVTIPLVIGFSAFAPLIVPLVARLLRPLYRGPLGELALASLRLDARRSASIAAPIMLVIACVTAISGALVSFNATAQQETLDTVQGELMVTTDQPAGSELAGVDGVEVVSEETPVQFELGMEYDGEMLYEPTIGLAMDPATYTQTRNVDLTAGDLADLNGHAIAASPSLAGDQNWRVGQMLPIRIDGADYEMRVVALLPPTVSGPFYLLPSDLASPEAAPWPWQHIVQTAGGADEGQIAQRLNEFGEVEPVERWVTWFDADFERHSNNVLLMLLGITMLYTVIAMINAVVISASHRRSEFAAARVTGLSRGQVIRVALWESQAVVAIGLLLGGVAAAGTFLTIAASTHRMVGITAISLQWPLLIALAFATVIVAGLTSVATTLSTTRTPPIQVVAARE